MDSVYSIILLYPQELAIERGVKDVQDTWANIAFTVSRHFNRGEDRGYTLNPCDEISVKLDDDAMTLQSMAASQLVMTININIISNDLNLRLD